MSRVDARKTALVTGATAGIGFHTAAVLATRGMRVIITGRDQMRGQVAVAEICERAGHPDVEFIPIDHSVVMGNQRLAHELNARLEGLDVLVNNVGGTA
jgi:short-subunit dehydrogenase